MSSDNHQFSLPPLNLSVREAYDVYQLARSFFRGVLIDFATADPTTADVLHKALSYDARVIRLLYLISRGYSGTVKFQRAVPCSDRFQARRQDFIRFDDESRIYVLTGKGAARLASWLDYMTPVQQLPRFAQLWNDTTII